MIKKELAEGQLYQTLKFTSVNKRGPAHRRMPIHTGRSHSDSMSLQAGTQSIRFPQKLTKKLTLIAFKDMAPRGPRDAERHRLPRSLVHVCVC